MASGVDSRLTKPAFPVRGGLGWRGGPTSCGTVGGTTTGGVVTTVDPGRVTPGPAAIGVAADGAAAAVGTAVGVTTTTTAGTGVAVAGTTVAARMTSLVTVARQVVRAPPPLAEPLHWSMLIGSAAVVVEPAPASQVKP